MPRTPTKNKQLPPNFGLNPPSKLSQSVSANQIPMAVAGGLKQKDVYKKHINGKSKNVINIHKQRQYQYPATPPVHSNSTKSIKMMNANNNKNVHSFAASTRNIHHVMSSSADTINNIDQSSPSPSSPHPHRMSVTNYGRAHKRANSMKLGKPKISASAASGFDNKYVSPYGSEPSLRDSSWLRSDILSSSDESNSILLSSFNKNYRFHICGLTNVMKLPR
eukprot:186482_1